MNIFYSLGVLTESTHGAIFLMKIYQLLPRTEKGLWHVLENPVTKLHKIRDLLGTTPMNNNETQCAYQREILNKSKGPSQSSGILEKLANSKLFGSWNYIFIRFLFRFQDRRAFRKLRSPKKIYGPLKILRISWKYFAFSRILNISEFIFLEIY